MKKLITISIYNDDLIESLAEQLDTSSVSVQDQLCKLDLAIDDEAWTIEAESMEQVVTTISSRLEMYRL
jgi:hypothetical protein